MNVVPLALLLSIISCQSSSKIVTERVEQPDYLWSRCYDELGCVNNTEEWYHPVFRPLTMPPLDRHIIKTSFYLFGKGKDSRHVVDVEPLEVNYKQIKLTSFDKTLKTHLLIHDFTSNGLVGWIKHSVKSIMSNNLGNVISVDWTGGAEPPYAIAVQNARVVALEIIYLLKILIDDLGMRPEQFHLIGHGLGAHVAGYVGRQINDIGRITGLDPNGLYFTDMSCAVRLDPDDARFVDIIYTDIVKNHGQGSGDTFGHFNFYPNGGLTQGGCNATSLYPPLSAITRDMLKEGDVAPGCNHKRATKYFTASLDEESECTMMGYLCPDYIFFQRAECVECQLGYTCAPMGYSAEVVARNKTAPPTAKFFLDTHSDRPYCMFAYKIIITMDPGEMANPETVSSSEVDYRVEGGMFCATVYSESEDIVFRTNLNMGIGQKAFILNGDNVFLTYQKRPKMLAPSKVVLRFDSEQNNTVVYVTKVRVVLLPATGKNVTSLCGQHEVTKFVPHTQEEFTPCKPSCKESRKSNTTRQRRNPEDVAPEMQSLIDMTAEDYEDENGEPPPPPQEDDYYSN
ncbi:pancreatic lipase-related protein 2-like isoform X2 [Cephus cinctus]|uniref:phospholipase A1 n=1 Tax=Cephus cinctus TaxID=211228 RepID=A0AAJ7RMD3_CEPCN|nr:pancreatic lipase-related protein 2-like isoform X2 [Cephus cinctus]